MNWIDIKERKPTEANLICGRVPILDKFGYIGYALFVPQAGGRLFCISDYDVAYWLEGVPPAPMPTDPEWLD